MFARRGARSKYDTGCTGAVASVFFQQTKPDETGRLQSFGELAQANPDSVPLQISYARVSTADGQHGQGKGSTGTGQQISRPIATGSSNECDAAGTRWQTSRRALRWYARVSRIALTVFPLQIMLGDLDGRSGDLSGAENGFP